MLKALFSPGFHIYFNILKLLSFHEITISVLDAVCPQNVALGQITSRLFTSLATFVAILWGLLVHSWHLVLTKELRPICKDGAGGMDRHSQVVASRVSLDSMVPVMKLGLHPDLLTLILLLFYVSHYLWL